MSTAFTPAPWLVKHSESKPAFNVVGTSIGRKYKIARCPYVESDRDKKEAEANAHLIAAGPELLIETEFNTEMLIGIAKRLDQWADESQHGGWSTHQVTPMRTLADNIRRQLAKQTALAKASGKKEEGE